MSDHSDIKPHWLTVIFGGAVAVLAAFLFYAAFDIQVRASEHLLGSRLFPLIVTAGLTVLAALVALDAWRNGASPETDSSPIAWSGAALVMGGLALFALLVEPVGFIVATAALFACVAHAFVHADNLPTRLKLLLRDLVIGLVLSTIIFIVFTRGLGLALPAGAIVDMLMGES
jgi:putative tricarboxylic transport membrane protein